MQHPPPTTEEIDRCELRIDAWLHEQLADNPAVVAVERDVESGERRWFVRVTGDEKSIFTIWFHLRQRNLHVETYLMPAPEENAAALYEHLLRRNLRLDGMTLAIGEEDGIFIIGQTPMERVDDDELDRLLGTMYAHVERCFRPAMRIGFEGKFQG